MGQSSHICIIVASFKVFVTFGLIFRFSILNSILQSKLFGNTTQSCYWEKQKCWLEQTDFQSAYIKKIYYKVKIYLQQ